MVWCNSSFIREEVLTDCEQKKNTSGDCEEFCQQIQCMMKSYPGSVVLAVLSSYLLGVVIAYEWQRRNERVRCANRLYLLSILCCFAVSCDALLVKFINEWNCTPLHVTGAAMYTLSNIFVFTAIWIRQTKFYSDPLLIGSSYRVYRAFNVAVIVGMLISTIASVSLFQVSYHLNSKKFVCVVVWSKGALFNLALASTVSAFVINTLFHILLLGLTVYPLINQEQNSALKLCCPLPQVIKTNKLRKDTKLLAKRLAVCTAAFCLESLADTALLNLSMRGSICIYWTALCQWHVLVTNTTLICSFSGGWKRLLIRKRSFNHDELATSANAFVTAG